MRLSPQLFICAANTLVGLGDSPADRAVNGPIDRMVKEAAGPGGVGPERWDIAFVHHCGFRSHFNDRVGLSAWPLPAAATAADLGTIGANLGALSEAAEVGDIFLQFSPQHRTFVHAGIVTHVGAATLYSLGKSYVDLSTIEGDTNEQGDLGGGRVVRLARRLWPTTGDRFLRWVDLEPYRIVFGSRGSGPGLVRSTSGWMV